MAVAMWDTKRPFETSLTLGRLAVSSHLFFMVVALEHCRIKQVIYTYTVLKLRT